MTHLDVVVPRLVVAEYAHLRLQRATEATEQIRSALKKASGHLEVPPFYVPSPEETVEDLISALTDLVNVAETHPDDAQAALRREASRVRPARDGKGARDSAIWLTVVRHHRNSDGHGVFVTTNTKDFADESRTSPHPQMIADLGDSADRFEFVFRPVDYLERVAPAIQLDENPLRDADFDTTYLQGVLAAALRSCSVFTESEKGMSDDNELSIWDEDNGMIDIIDSRVIAAHSLKDPSTDGISIAKFDITAEFPLAGSGDRAATADFRLWLEFSEDRTSLIEIESIRRRPN